MIVSEREADHKIALILVGMQERSDRIPKVLRPPARVAKFRSHPEPSRFEFHASAEGAANVRIFVELGHRAY